MGRQLLEEWHSGWLQIQTFFQLHFWSTNIQHVKHKSGHFVSHIFRVLNFRYWSIPLGWSSQCQNYIQNFGHWHTLWGLLCPDESRYKVSDFKAFHRSYLVQLKITSKISDIGALYMDQYIWMKMTYKFSDIGKFHRGWSMSKLNPKFWTLGHSMWINTSGCKWPTKFWTLEHFMGVT